MHNYHKTPTEKATHRDPFKMEYYKQCGTGWKIYDRQSNEFKQCETLDEETLARLVPVVSA